MPRFYGDEKKVTGIRETEYRQGMPWDENHADSKNLCKTVLRIRRDWIGPRRMNGEPFMAAMTTRLVVFERYGAHTVRVIIHMGEAPADAERFMNGGQLLLLKGSVSHMLEKMALAVLLMA